MSEDPLDDYPWAYRCSCGHTERFMEDRGPSRACPLCKSIMSRATDPELYVDPAQMPFDKADRELLLAMSKVLVAISQDTNAKKWGGDLAIEQFKYRQKFFPETIEP